ncbi:glycoside hydrolase family 3 N-terminal domain-containing protein [Bifidobacterium scardovii]|uniref:glycoside hydrolase family 3 N-terminal domain-containing protein n=1 Tax=Bifidobacterium scardovii TaxID=158787 RepID=UPI00254FA9BE|nr:glycoside hydrolase family 3 N-terminal domain-containing protein [Bifidobacterium scardovii]MDK6349184.1 glycoside hydrolase family 3 N-terminal domain-containing protein [Bifidobacterium scardovii]
MNHEQLVELVSEMTLDEKIAQLLQLSGDFYSDKAEERTGPIAQLGLSQTDIDNAGTILGVASAAECRRIQQSYMERNRLHIPTLIMGDVIHGCRTIFPIPLAIGSSWSTDAARTMARVAARESSASGLHVTFSPMVDLVRDPRWGRVMESTGEDPWLNALMAAAMVEGYQGGRAGSAETLADPAATVGACVKHFAGYGAPEGGREYNTVNMSERQLRNDYLPGYHAGIDAGAKLVMTSFNTVDGIPATGNRNLMRDILRDEFGFDGVLISDFGAVREMIAHGVAADDRQAAQLAIEAGVDIEMMTVCYLRELRGLIEDGRVPESMLDESVMRILELKNDLGLFEHPFRGADPEAEARVVLCDDHRQAARTVAEESMVLLKNEGILPLRRSETIALVGPHAASHDVLGAWSWKGDPAEAVRAVNPNIVVVLFNGRPLDLTAIDDARAIVEAWFPGTEAGSALAAVLYGEANPSARLTMSFPYSVGQVPVYYNQFNTGRPAAGRMDEKYVSKYLDVPNDARYPFGFGLSYSSFAYGPVSVSGDRFSAGRPLEIAVDVTNTSTVGGVETVQLYVRDVVGEVVRPVKELKGFERVRLEAGETRTVRFSLGEEQLRYVHSDLDTCSDPGEFLIMVGPNSRDLSEPVSVSLI